MADKVLIIDDDKFVYNRLKSVLDGIYDTRSALDGDIGLQAANDWQPDMILLDIEMPGRNGYEVCDVLKRQESTRNIPVLFLSSKSSIRERMLGYQVGADDYIIKSSAQDELAAKLSRMSKYLQSKQDLKKSAETANQTALQAMSTSFELGKAIRFVERSQMMSSVDVLGEQLMEFMADLDLNAASMIRGASGCYFYSSTLRDVTPLEAQLMEMLHSEERFIDFGSRTQVNYPHVALLVKNMPVENPEQYGRLKDTLPFVLGAADAKIRVLDAEYAMLQQSSKLNDTIDSVRSTLSTMTGTFNNNLSAVSSIMSELVATISIDLMKMGLDPDQEEFVGAKVEDAAEKVTGCLLENNRIELSLREVVARLEQVRDEQFKVIQDKLSSKPKLIENKNDIELF